MIDLRSDTVTTPTEAMREAMVSAEVGDDVYGDDPTVNRLEAMTAEILGKEAAVYVPTGSMSNQIAVRVHVQPGDLILLDANAHIALNEGGGAAAISGATMKPLPGTRGVFTADHVHDAIGRRHPFNPTTLQPAPALVSAENTHNAGGGTVWPLEELRAVAEAARAHGLAVHLDGARLWHATAASGVAEHDYAEPFDTVNVCFSKGLGAPIGSALAGSTELIGRARRFKQQLGGGFRQAGIIAAAALHALEHHRAGLVDDVRNARTFAEALSRLDGIRVDLGSVQSNIVRFEVLALPAGEFATRCHELGVHMLPGGATGMRAVMHRDVGADELDSALRVIGAVLTEAMVGAAEMKPLPRTVAG